MMEAAPGTARWRTGIGLSLAVASLVLSCVTCAMAHRLVRMPSLRLGPDINEATLILCVGLLLGISGVWVTPSSKRWLAITLFVISFLVGGFGPALQPARSS
jgi:hypothetical protein